MSTTFKPGHSHTLPVAGRTSNGDFDLRRTVEELVLALAYENEAEKRARRPAKLTNGRMTSQVPGFYFYEFQTEGITQDLCDQEITLNVAGSEYECELVAIGQNKVELSLKQNLGLTIDGASLLANQKSLNVLLAEQLRETLENTPEKFRMSVSLFTGVTGSAIGNSSAAQYSFQPNSPPNESQAKAIAASFSKALAVIWGPPGTGKTRTIARAVEAHLRAGRRVLMVSHANTAVDGAVEDIAEQLKDSFYKDGRIIRLGPPRQPSLLKNYPLLSAETASDSRCAPLIGRREKILSDRDAIDRLLRVHNLLSQKQTRAVEIEQQLALLEQPGSAQNMQLSRLEENIRELEQQESYFNQRLNESTLADPRLRNRTDNGASSLQQQLKFIRSQIYSVKQLHAEKLESIRAGKARHKPLRDELHELMKETGRLCASLATSLEEAGKKLSSLKRTFDSLNNELSSLDVLIKDTRSKIVSEAALVATTITRTFTSRELRDLQFDVLIVDEASMTPLPHLFWAATKALAGVTIVGDFKQLPPICKSEKQESRKWLKRSIFDVLRISSVERAMADERVSMLDTQYRMAPPIAAIASKLFYGGLLKSAVSTKLLTMRDALSSDAQLVLIDTANTGGICTIPAGGSRINLHNAERCAKLASILLAEQPDTTIGIATIFRAQADTIRKMINERGLTERVQVNTVHSFQGGEASVIIFDTVVSDGAPSSPMLDEKSIDSDAEVLLNVAITRARKKFFLIANSEFLRKAYPDGRLIRQLIDIIGRHGMTIDGQVLNV